MNELLDPTAPKGTVVVFPGSWETIIRPDDSDEGTFALDNWSQFRREMRSLGYSALVLDSLPAQDSSATPEDHVRAAIDEMDERATSRVVMFAGYSAGGLLVIPTLEELERRGRDTSGVLVSYVTASLPKPSPEAMIENPLLADVPENRNTEDFRESLRTDEDEENGLTSLHEDDAWRLLFNRATWWAGHLAVANMRPTVRLDSSRLFLPAHLKHRTRYYLDPAEMVRNTAQVDALERAYAADDFEVVVIPDAGHAIHVSRPGALARGFAEFANADDPSPRAVEPPRNSLPRQRKGEPSLHTNWSPKS